MAVERFDFPGSDGQRLAGRLDRPDGAVTAYALFAHCFTCGKDIAAASRIAKALSDRGIAVLRFDFTGLGGSEGEFSNSNFSSNVDDLVAAADHLRARYAAPALLIGHSLGGAAILAAAERMPEAKAVVTIAAPFEAAHIRHLLHPYISAIEQQGSADVVLAGRRFSIRQQFLDDIESQDQVRRIRELRKALLIMHAPTDDLVGIENASSIFTHARHPKSFISLDDADHLLSRQPDAEYAGSIIACWASRYVRTADPVPRPESGEGLVMVSETGAGKFQQRVLAGSHRLIADEPETMGGLGSGPTPYDLLLAALGTCTAMTIRMYADRQHWSLRHVEVKLRHDKVHAADCADCVTKDAKIDHIAREIMLTGDLDPAQRARLMEIASRCPVHRTLHSEVRIVTEERAE